MKKKERKNQYYSKAFKWGIVQEYLSTGISQLALRKKYNIKGHDAIPNWVRIFKVQKSEKKEMKQKKTEKKDMQYVSIANLLNTQNGQSRLSSKESKRLCSITEETILHAKKLSESNVLKSKRIEELEAELKKKNQLLKNEQFKAIAYETLIDVAEKTLKITIRKKSDAKQ